MINTTTIHDHDASGFHWLTGSAGLQLAYWCPVRKWWFIFRRGESEIFTTFAAERSGYRYLLAIKPPGALQ